MPALEAWEEIQPLFYRDETEKRVYPDNYAGAYYESGRLHLMVVGDDTDNYTSRISNQDTVEFHAVEYSYNDLIALGENIKNQVSNPIRISVNDNENLLEIGVESIDIALDNEIRQIAADNLMMRNADELDRSNDLLPVRVSESPVDEAFSELWSGDRIQSAGGIRCTLGSTGYYNGSSAVVTCGHGLSLNQTLYYNDSRIGEVRFHRFLDDAYGDYSIVPLSNTEHSIVNKSFGPSESSSNPIRVTGYSAEPPRGVSVFAYGQHNGWSIAKVIDSDVTVNVSVLGQVTTIKGLTVLKTSSGRVGHGDSGGPVYIYNGNGYSVCGIISSGSVSNRTYNVTPFELIVDKGYRVLTSN